MNIQERLLKLPRAVKRLIMVAVDGVMLPIVVWAAFSLRLGEPIPGVLLEHAWLLVIVPLVTLPVFVRFGLYRAVLRYIGPQAAMAVIYGATLSALLFAAIVTLVRLEDVPRATIVIYWLVTLLMIGGSRFAIRAWFQGAGTGSRDKKAVVIYGAGAGGVQLATSLANGSDYHPIAFVDDDPAKQGTIIAGMRVHNPSQLPELIHRKAAGYVLLAMPGLSRSRRSEIVQQLEPLRAHILTMPSLNDIVGDRADLDQVRDVGIEDLLGRDAVSPRHELSVYCISGKSVMVTGAGGSIGAELCRQILRLQPNCIVLVERSEFALYTIERELRSHLKAMDGLGAEVCATLADVADPARMEALIRGFDVDTVYHAAAYKHVPLVEVNALEGVRNNVFGTLHTARAAAQAGVEHFVLISTDKAVRPTNVMGATKRTAELLLQGLARQPDMGTVFSIVRFGNVLGSSGSVVPLFREQIRNGGPVTVTHPDVTRYFMTISEAASLVLQAGAMARGGEVFVLDMGEPVKILDLARRMIHLSGLQERDVRHPDGDIEIRFTGLRPGEKLHEELVLGQAVSGTDHPMIMQATEGYLTTDAMQRLLDGLQTASERSDPQYARKVLAKFVEGYKTSVVGRCQPPPRLAGGELEAVH